MLFYHNLASCLGKMLRRSLVKNTPEQTLIVDSTLDEESSSKWHLTLVVVEYPALELPIN